MTDRRYQKTKFGQSHHRRKDNGREIMSASYERSAVSLTTPNLWQREDSGMNKYTKDRWKVILRAVPITELAEVRNCLDKEGYAKVIDWFIATNKYAGSIGSHNLSVWFDGAQLIYRQYDSV